MQIRWETYKKSINQVGPVGYTVWTLISSILPISMIVLGAVHLDNCSGPAERFINIYLIVSGSFAIILLVVRALGSCLRDDKGNKPMVLDGIFCLILVFHSVWVIAGIMYYIYHLHGKYSPDSTAANHCDNTTYLYAFWVLIGLGIVLCCCICCSTACESAD